MPMALLVVMNVLFDTKNSWGFCPVGWWGCRTPTAPLQRGKTHPQRVSWI